MKEANHEGFEEVYDNKSRLSFSFKVEINKERIPQYLLIIKPEETAKIHKFRITMNDEQTKWSFHNEVNSPESLKHQINPNDFDLLQKIVQEYLDDYLIYPSKPNPHNDEPKYQLLIEDNNLHGINYIDGTNTHKYLFLVKAGNNEEPCKLYFYDPELKIKIKNDFFEEFIINNQSNFDMIKFFMIDDKEAQKNTLELPDKHFQTSISNFFQMLLSGEQVKSLLGQQTKKPNPNNINPSYANVLTRENPSQHG